MVSLAPLDIAIILLYFAAVVFIGIRSSRRQKNSSDEYLLASRSLTLPVFVATLVSTWYGGILGVGEYSYRYGISNWLVFGVPYYFFALVFALFLARKARATNLVTIPDKLYIEYDVKTSLVGALLTFVLVSPAPYVLMLGILVQLIFGISLVASILISTFLTVCYLYAGGFRSDVNTNVAEFILMFAGFIIIVPFAYEKFGGIAYLRAHLPPLHLTWHGGNTLQFMLVWFFIALWTLVDPAFHQRCYAAKDGAVAQRGIIISTMFWFIFDFFTSTAGLYARAALPHLEQPVFAYPMLAEVTLPAIAKGMFYVGMLATVMSTLSSLTFIGAVTVGNDIVGRLLMHEKEDVRSAAVTLWTKIGLVISALFAVFLAILVPSVVKLWYIIGTAIIPGLLVPLMASYFEKLRISSSYAFAAMCLGCGVSTTWLIFGLANGGEYFFSIEPMYPGLSVSLIVWGVGRVAETRRANLRSRNAA